MGLFFKGMADVANLEPSYTRPMMQVVTSEIGRHSSLRGSVLVLGNFDGFHCGHQRLIWLARQIGRECLPIGIMSVEPHPRQFFGEIMPFRLSTPRQKLEAAKAAGLNYLFQPTFDSSFAGLSPEAFVEQVLHRSLGVIHVVVGEDFRFGAKRAGDCAVLARECSLHGIKVTAAPLYRGYSSSAAREAILDGNIPLANEILGRYWQPELNHALPAPQLSRELIRPPAGFYRIRTAGKTRTVECDGDGRLISACSRPTDQIQFIARLG